MKMKMITMAELESMGERPCKEAMDWFRETHPDGATLAAAWESCPHDDWRVWYACHTLPREKVIALAYRFAGQAFRYAARAHVSLEPWADNVTPENVAAARAAVAAAWAAREAARAAMMDEPDVAEAMDEAARAAWAARAAASAWAWVAAWVALAEDAAWAAWEAARAAMMEEPDTAAADVKAARAEQAQWCAEALGIEEEERMRQ